MAIKKPIPISFGLDSHNSVQSVCAVIHIDDKNTETLDLSLMQGGEHIAVSPNSTVTARFVRVKNNTLISDDVACTVQENGNIHIPIDNAAAHMLVGEIKIEVNIVDENDILTMQFPLVIRVNNTILADAGICPISKGTIPELIEEAREAAESATQAAEAATEAISTKQDKLTAGQNITITEENVISASSGSNDYTDLTNKPSINNVTLSGNKSSDDLSLQGKLTAGNNITINNGVISAEGGVTSYDDLTDKPQINNVELSGNKTLAALGINAGSVGFDETGTYTDGSVGKELSEQKNAFNTITDETKLLADGYGVIPSEMVHGSGSSENGSVVSPYNYRVTSKDIVSFDRDVTLKSKTGFVFNLYFFTAQGAYDTFVQNQTSYSLANNKKVRVTIKRSTEDTSEVADIPLFASSVYYEGEPLQRINKLNNFVVDEEYTDFSGGFISTNTTPVNLTPTPTSSYKCIVVDCSEGDAFQVTGSGSVSNTVFAFLNSSDTVITKSPADISIHDLELVAPANTAKAVFNFRTSYDIKLVKNPASYIADKTNRNNEARIENTAFCFSNDDNLIENTKMVGGYLTTESGDVTASATYYTTDYIFVPKDKTIRFEPNIRKFLAYDYPSAPIAGSFVDLITQGAYEYTATHDCYVRVTIAKEYVGITQAKILPFIVDSAVIGANDLIEFATIQNIKKCTFSKSGRELTVATSENDTYCCVDILTNAFEADNLYYFDIDIKTATGSGKGLRVLFLGTESNQNNTYSGVRTDYVSAGDKIKVFACAKKGCRGIRLFITGGTSGDATFVFNHLSIYKVLKINEPEKKKERRFMQPKARVSIMDDDGYVTFYQYLLPMIRTYGIPIATAYQGDNGYELRDQLMTREQLHEVEEAGGEIIAHGYNSLINLGSEAEADIILSKKMLNASGFFPTVYVYPYGDNNQNIRQLVEKYFDCSFKVATPYPPDYRTEAGCVPMFRLNRCHCGGENYDVPVTTGRYANLDTASMDYFEALIQECIARKSWLVLYTHSWQMEEGQQPTGYDNQFDLMEAIIKRILELKESGTDIDIIKFEDGIKMFGNAFQAGDYLGQSNNDLTLHTNPGCAISKQGLYDFPAGNNMTPST